MKIRQAKVYFEMLGHWIKMVGGKSYWHQPQGIGRVFRPGELLGYFNDLTGKAAWPGEVDEHCIPLSILSGQKVYWPTTVLQKGLAHWDLWLESGRMDDQHRLDFLNVARWALENQDESGGWRHPVPLHPRALSEYSCMSQGQGASVLVRAYSETGDEHWLRGAQRAIEAMLRATSEGGTAVYEGQSIALEEFPSRDQRTVLNGWVFGIYGLYDYQLAAGDEATNDVLQRTLRTFQGRMPQFDCGFWSLYDCRGAIASPFYHELHIAQLGALALTFLEYAGSFTHWAQRFEKQSASRRNLLHAVTTKAGQKLRNPPIAIAKA